MNWFLDLAVATQVALVVSAAAIVIAVLWAMVEDAKTDELERHNRVEERRTERRASS